MEKIKVESEIEVTVKMIGGKSKPLVLYFLNERGTSRFNEILKHLKHISPKTLTNQLRELESDGLIDRVAYAEVPPRVEYTATKKGESLMPILELMCEWGEKNAGDRYEITNPQCE